MTIIDRLKKELGNKDYYEDDTYITLLGENDLISTNEYDKPNHQKKLLWTIVDIFEMLSNDIDLMRKVDTEFLDTTEAYKTLRIRIEDIKRRINTIADPVDEEANSIFSLMFTRGYR